MVRTGATVADACAEYLRYIEQDRDRKPSTLRDYDSIFRNHVLPHLAEIRLEDLTAERVERWAAHEIDPQGELVALRRRDVDFAGSAIARAGELHQPPPDLAEVRQGQVGPDGAQGGGDAREAEPARVLHRRRRRRRAETFSS
jgi:hypothetical protein